MKILFTEVFHNSSEKGQFIMDTSLLKNPKLKERVEFICSSNKSCFLVEEEYEYCFPDWDEENDICDLDLDTAFDVTPGHIDITSYWVHP